MINRGNIEKMKSHIEVMDYQVFDAANLIKSLYDGTEYERECIIEEQNGLCINVEPWEKDYYMKNGMTDTLREEIKEKKKDTVYVVKREDIEEFCQRLIQGIYVCVTIHILTGHELMLEEQKDYRRVLKNIVTIIKRHKLMNEILESIREYVEEEQMIAKRDGKEMDIRKIVYSEMIEQLIDAEIESKEGIEVDRRRVIREIEKEYRECMCGVIE